MSKVDEVYQKRSKENGIKKERKAHQTPNEERKARTKIKHDYPGSRAP
jgi:hypothetical protein